MPDVTLRISGHEYGGWKSVVVTASLEQLAGTFDLVISDRWPGQLERQTIKRGAPCTLHYGGHLLITGYIDEVRPAFDKSSHTIRISGRDRTCDLVDCCHVGKTQEWKAEDLLTIAREVCEPFGIEVATEVDLGGKLPLEKYNQGDTIHAFLLRLARKQSVIMASYGDGRLVFTRAGAARVGVALKQGENILAARAEGTNKDRFSEYHVKGQGSTASLDFSPPLPGADTYQESMDLFTEAVASAALAHDPGVARFRPLVILSETAAAQADMETRARWEAANRAGRSLRATVTVKGWEAKPGALWRINRLVPVDCPFLGMNGDYLIEKVSYRLDGQDGQLAELGLIHPDAYLPEPLKKGKGVASTPLDFSEKT